MGDASRLTHGFLNVAAAGTPQQLSQAGSREIIVQARPSNTGNVAIGGDNTVRAATGAGQRGLILTPTASPVKILVDDVSDIWVDAATNGEGINYLYTSA